MSLAKSFRSSCEQNRAKTALALAGESYTYSEVDRLTSNIARHLAAAGAEPGDRIAIHFLNSLEFALTAIACIKSGCIAVPVNTRLKGREVDYILRHSGAAFYVGEGELYESIASTCPALADMQRRFVSAVAGAHGITPFDELLGSSTRRDFALECPAESPAAILYTSGTTAHPKGVVHSHETLSQLAGVMRNARLDQDQVVLIMSSMAHLIGFGMLFLSAFLTGATTVITRPFDFAGALDAYERRRCTYTAALPVLFKELLEAQHAAPRDVSSGNLFFCGGDSAPTTLQQSFQRAFAPLCEGYGLTEIAPASWNRPGEIRVGSIGRACEGVSFRLLDAGGKDVPRGATGEICVRGPHLMNGYWRDPASTAMAFHGSWFKTGDLAYEDADGYYWFAARKKEVIVRGGSNVSPQEVEAALYEHPAVAEAAVTGQADALWGEIVVAHVVVRPDHDAAEEQLIRFVRERVADYKAPEKVVFHCELPKGPSGKILRRALRDDTSAKGAARHFATRA